MTCSNCGKTATDSTSKFCSGCGEQFPGEELPPYIGELNTKGIYRITFASQEDEFDSENAAWDVAHDSGWDGDRDFEGETRVELVRSTVTKETHPFECSVCIQIVAKNKNGRCSGCCSANWRRR